MLRVGTTSYVNAWENVMLEIKDVSKEAFKYLMNIPSRFWSK